ncbi:hypothetical protein V5O48_006354 [Marasmius crinis-equi]|uniref:Non-reducing end beta-L-arabinofuranosidase-like GH127 middle domain-containing protein n=1 Tax=Marasmius crinis-equi TaxID=585013 RepID=A0ABR3FKB0_9AGAR
MFSNQGCGAGKTVQDLFNKDDGSGNQQYTFVPVSGMQNTFNIKNKCGQFLSCQACSGQTKTDLFDKDDGSGRQRWTLVPVSGQSNTYNIKVAGGRDASCGVFLSTGAACTDNFVDLFTKDDGSGRQQWVLNKVDGAQPPSSSSATTPPASTTSAASLPTDGPAVTLDSSLFYTVSLAKGKQDGCNPLNNMFSNRGCDSPVHDLYFKDDGSKNQYWRFVPVSGSNNVFNIMASCAQYLSCQACSGKNTTDLFSTDDASGRQRWLLTPVSGAADTYTIRVAGGRDVSCGSFLSAAQDCKDNAVYFFTSDDGSGRQQWVVKAVGVDTYVKGSLPLAPLKYNTLPLGAVKPTSDSWLSAQLQAQGNGLHGHLQDFWDTIKDSNWIGGKGDYSELNEAGSYWLNGLVPAAFQLNDERLLGAVNTWVDYIIGHQGSDGWLGPTGDGGTRVLWGRYPVTLALMQYAQANRSATSRVVDSLQKFFVGMEDMMKKGSGLEEWGIMRWQDPAIVIHWLIENHANGQEATYENLLKLLRYSGANWKGFFTDDSFPKDAVNAVSIKAHGVNVGQAIKSEAVAYRYTHDDSDLDSTKQRADLIDKYHGSVSGVLKADEHLAGLHPSRGSELCTVVEMMYSYEYAYSVVGENTFADRVEKLAFNALPGTFIEDMWGHQYLQQGNQPWAKHMDPKVFATAGSHAYMTSPDGSTLHHVLLSPTTVTTTLSGNNAVTVTAKTNYPFNTLIEYATKADKAFNLAIRVPGWVSSSISYTVDGGSSQNGSPDGSGYVVVKVSEGSHTVQVNIPMAVQTEERFNSARAVTRGPLVYSLDVGYTENVLKSYDLNSKDWQLDPSASWQVAIDATTLKFNGDANSSNLAGTSSASVFSQSGAPVSMSATGCPISWNVVANSADAPPSSPAVCTGGENGVKLIPYGAAKLRMSELPTFASEGGKTQGSGGGEGGKNSALSLVGSGGLSWGLLAGVLGAVGLAL